MCVHACIVWCCVFPSPSVGKMRTEGYCFVAFQLTGFLKYTVMAWNHLVREWPFFFFNSPGNLQLNLEVTERECIVKTFKPFCFFSHLPKLKNDQRGCDFLIPIDLADSCAEGRPRALAPGLAGAEGSLAQPLPPHEEWDPERPYLPLELLPPALALTFQTIFSLWSEPQWQPRSIIHNT